MVERRSIVVDGVLLSYLEREADGPKPPLLLLHGVIASSSTFNALIAELPEDCRVVALDLPGTDLPERPKQSDMSLCGLARLVRDFAQAVGLRQPMVLGHSHGGAIALQLAAASPGAVSGLILLCPAHPFLYRERPLIAFYNSWLGHLFARSLRWTPALFMGVGFNRLLGPAGRKARIDFKPYREPFLRRGNVNQVLRLVETWNHDMDALGKQIEQHPIPTPTLFLWGDHDPIVPIVTAPALQRYMQLWEQVTLPGVGHLPNDEATAECGRAIQSWLAKQAGEV